MDVLTPSVRELKPGFGAEILDLDLARASPAERAGAVATFHRHGAILVRDQAMSPDDLMTFIAAFGEPEGHTLGEFTLPGYPKIYILSNRTMDGVPIGAHNDGVGWHTDYSYKAEPVMCTMLYAVEVPPEGSDTLLADCFAAWNALPPERQAELRRLMLHHSYQHFMAHASTARASSHELKAAEPGRLPPAGPHPSRRRAQGAVALHRHGNRGDRHARTRRGWSWCRNWWTS